MASLGTAPVESHASTRARPVRALVSFFVLAYLISWAWLVPLALGGQIVEQGRGWPTHLPALIGPMLAAVIVTAVVYGSTGLRDLFRRVVRWRVGWRWWVVAISPVLMLPTALLIGRIAGAAVPSAGDFANFTGVWSGLGVLGVLAVLLVAGFGEETGWRGFAVPHLELRFSPLTTALIVAPLWALWHLPQSSSWPTFEPSRRCLPSVGSSA
jgi:membrane protease YdiL (CAAX protease family)